ncbi:hypothetical protein A9G35_06865 [Gilliamella sp. Choc5-1]|nr:hypothetical protein A9G35_06865 [Gilliamella apicola]
MQIVFSQLTVKLFCFLHCATITHIHRPCLMHSTNGAFQYKKIKQYNIGFIFNLMILNKIKLLYSCERYAIKNNNV